MQLIPETDPRLRASSVPYIFTPETQEAREQFVQEMFEAMTASRGIGLAAPQIGINVRLFVMEVDGERLACFNPEVIQASETTQLDDEGCLSFPDLFMKVQRSASVTAKFYDVQGNEVIRTFDGLAARCYQHELEHLEGVCFVDKVSPLVLGMAKKRRTKIRKHK